MRLEVGTFDVRDVVFSDNTRLSDGVLYVDRDRGYGCSYQQGSRDNEGTLL